MKEMVDRRRGGEKLYRSGLGRILLAQLGKMKTGGRKVERNGRKIIRGAPLTSHGNGIN